MLLFISVLLQVAAVLGDTIEFVSPGPSTSNSDPSISNAIHPIGSNFHIAWSGTNTSRDVTIVLYQFNGDGDGLKEIYPLEYVVDGVAGGTSTDWTVATARNLTLSNMFLFNLYYTDESNPLAVSETFNITGDASSTTTSSTTSDYPVLTTFIYETATSTAARPAATTSSSSTAAVSEKSSSGLTTGTKAGIGVAVPFVALGALAVGYYLFRRRAKKQQEGLVGPPVDAEQVSSPEKEQELPELMAGTMEEPQPYELHGVSGTPSMLYELSSDVAKK